MKHLLPCLTHRFARIPTRRLHHTALGALTFAVSLSISPALAASTTAPVTAPVTASGKGCAIAIGGALAVNNTEVWQRVVNQAGGKGARFAVFASAAGEPERSAASIIASLQRQGAVAEHSPVAVKLKSPDWRTAVKDPALIAKVRASNGVYFAGGSQSRITEVLLDPSGKPTAMLEAIWSVLNKGGVVAGSSAGAAIMSETMFNEPQPVLDILKFGIKPKDDLARGLGFVGPGVMVDQHFLKRGRFGRLLPALQHSRIPLGIGVDENTAAMFCGRQVEVFGGKGALVIDLHDAETDATIPEFNVRNAKLTYLDRGDRYDLDRRVVTPSAQKLAGRRIDPNAKDFKPYFKTDEFQPDVLGDTVVANLMGNFIDNAQQEVVGLAFDGLAATRAESAPERRPELGFEFRFRKGPDSVGWFTSAFGGEDYTVANIRLDVAPVTLSVPLYRKRAAGPLKP